MFKYSGYVLESFKSQLTNIWWPAKPDLCEFFLFLKTIYKVDLRDSFWLIKQVCSLIKSLNTKHNWFDQFVDMYTSDFFSILIGEQTTNEL